MSLPVRATLGTAAFHGWTGWAPPVLANIEVFSRLGQIGSGSQVVNNTSPQFGASAWKAFSSQTDAQTFADLVASLQGSVVQLTDPFGRTMKKVRIISSSATPKRANGSPVSGSTQSTYLVTCAITLERLP